MSGRRNKRPGDHPGPPLSIRPERADYDDGAVVCGKPRQHQAHPCALQNLPVDLRFRKLSDSHFSAGDTSDIVKKPNRING